MNSFPLRALGASPRPRLPDRNQSISGPVLGARLAAGRLQRRGLSAASILKL